jgi:hypothetical protein
VPVTYIKGCSAPSTTATKAHPSSLLCRARSWELEHHHHHSSPLLSLLARPVGSSTHTREKERHKEMALLLLLLAVLGVVLASSLLLRWNELRYSRRRGLPPGTMGWPLFGETTEFLKQGPSFMKQRRLRYRAPPAPSALHSARSLARPMLCLFSPLVFPRGKSRVARPRARALLALPSPCRLQYVSVCLSLPARINHLLERKCSSTREKERKKEKWRSGGGAEAEAEHQCRVPQKLAAQHCSCSSPLLADYHSTVPSSAS